MAVHNFKKSFRDGALAKWKTRPRSERRVLATLGLVLFVVINGALLLFVALTFSWLYKGLVLVRLIR